MIPETMIHDQHFVKLARIKEEVLYFNRWRIFTELVIDQCCCEKRGKVIVTEIFWTLLFSLKLSEKRKVKLTRRA